MDVEREYSKNYNFDIEEVKILSKRLTEIDKEYQTIMTFFYTINVALLVIYINFIKEDTVEHIRVIGIPIIGYILMACMYLICYRLWIHSWNALLFRINFLIARIRNIPIWRGFWEQGWISPYQISNTKKGKYAISELQWYQNYEMKNMRLKIGSGTIILSFHVFFWIIWALLLCFSLYNILGDYNLFQDLSLLICILILLLFILIPIYLFYLFISEKKYMEKWKNSD